MSETVFTHDVFLSHSSKDKLEVRVLAERLRKDGLRVWIDELEIRPGDSIPAKIEEGLEQSRILVLCISTNAVQSDWAQLEAGTFRFRDPLNRKRRFIPLRLDASPVKGSLAQFSYIKWFADEREQEYGRLLAACRDPESWPPNAKVEADDSTEKNHIARLVAAQRSEWKRLRSDFEAEAQKYQDAKASVFYVAKDGPMTKGKFPQPNHAICLWQFYGSTHSKETMDQLRSMKLTKFGMARAELSAYGLITGMQTSLFCKMAERAGSLLPDKITNIVADRIFKAFDETKEPGKQIVVSNPNPIAKWLNLMLMATATIHPQRFKDGFFAADPFAASLAVFDYFKLGE